MGRILIVEDEANIAQVLEEVLSDEGYDVVALADGQEALDWLQQEKSLPDLVLVDLFMPRVNGKEIVTYMRSRESLATVPILLVTGAVPSAHDFPPFGSYQGIIGKPFDIADILEKVAYFLPQPPPRRNSFSRTW
ncbi:MAG TPA: response regulator [Firmicutes bacterium]|nr:response regulator [Bacillota bacterium]